MYTILIVEDEKLIRQGIRVIVERSGIPIKTIFECNNGLAALDVLKNEQVDVMFTDIRMPKMNGIDLVHQVNRLKDKPLMVAISGYDDFNYAVQLLREGVREYLLKPVERDHVKKVLEKLIAELEQKKQEEVNNRRIGWQQLKYMLLNQEITEEEKELINEKYGKLYLDQWYRIGCAPINQLDACAFKESIILKEVNHHTLYIMASQKDLDYFSETGRYVGVSDVHKGIEALVTAYEEAVEARQKAFCTNTRVNYYNESPLVKTKALETLYTFDDKIMMQIVQLIGTDKIREALRLLKLMGQGVQEGYMTYKVFEGYVRDLVEEIIHTYQNVLETENVTMQGLENILSYPCVESYIEELIKWVIIINEKIMHTFDDYKNKQKIKEAIDYIKKYYDTDVNMAIVSNHISMNYSLFSHLFKQYTNKNFVTYLKDIRMKEAKKLLENTELKISEISRKVGYDNEKHFMKLFKSVCGVSPTEYRKNMLFKDVKR